MRTRIAILITELHPAGAERVVYELATRLDAARFEVRVYSLASRDGDDGAIARALEDAGIGVFPARMRSKFDVFGVRRLVRDVRDFRPHVLHAHLFHANLAARLFGRRAGAAHVVSTVHIVERRPLRLRRILERVSAGRDDVTVCVSEAVAAHARTELGVPSPRVIHNGIDVASFATLPDREAARRAFGVQGVQVVGCAARLSEQKGIDVLLRALALLPAVKLLLAGDGEERAKLQRLAVELGVADRVRFVGHLADVRQLFAALDVFCLPSRWEGFGLAVLEAMAAGLPVVTTDVDSLPEVVGDAGRLVPPGDVPALAAALTAALSEASGEAPSDAGRQRAARFGVESMVAQYAALYDELSSRA